MENTRLKFRVGVHEFEAEGPAEVVQEQLRAFRELIETASDLPVAPEGFPAPANASQSVNTDLENSGPAMAKSADEIDQALTKIMKVEQRFVSLTARAGSTIDAVLLIVYGQKILRENDAVTGAEVMHGLKTTGIVVARVDRVLAKAYEVGDIMSTGTRRAKRYRLTNQGIEKARQIAAKLIDTVA